MKNQAFRMTMLYDFYGDLLTDRQREFYDLYYNDDLSLTEIAENYGITRQGVRDIVVRAEKSLEEFEEKTGLIRQTERTRATASTLAAIAEEIYQLNAVKLKNRDLDNLSTRLKQTIQELGRT